MRKIFGLIVIALLLSACQGQAQAPAQFSGKSAFTYVDAQMNFGPRPTGSPAWQKTGDYIVSQAKKMGWTVDEQKFEYKNTPIRNIIACKGSGPVIILGAHYDTRRRADRDLKNPAAPVPGADDGASGVAVLLELARTLDVAKTKHEVWLAFFDAEDNGDLDGWDWLVGSAYMAEHLTIKPEAVIVVDMIGDADQQIYWDQNSDPAWNRRIWSVAASLGYDKYLIPNARWSMFDDHTPFAQKGIPAVDMIDFDYPYWHTTADLADKLSPDSLEHVGRTLEVLLEQNP